MTENSSKTHCRKVVKIPLKSSIVVFGASGDLAKKKTFPALFQLFRYGFLDGTSKIVGYARSALSRESFIARLRPFLEQKFDSTMAEEKDGERNRLISDFFRMCEYVQGSYDAEGCLEGYGKVSQLLDCHEQSGARVVPPLRVFYLALPPSVFISASKGIKAILVKDQVICRVIVEKPFGRDLDSSNLLSVSLSELFLESQIYRMDHYLGKEMVKNILSVRFKNPLFSRLWSHEGISQIEILFKEMIGVEGRGHYFDNYGIVRDVMQNHLLQIMTLIAMEEPEVIHPRTADLGKTSIMDATSVNGDAIRNEKVNVLACIRPLDIQQVLLGQYTGCSTATATVNASDKALLGYKEDPTVPDDSMTATYAKCVLYVANERWQSVPFILQCGKALDEQKTEIKITFKNGEMNLKNENIPEMKDDTEITNELVIRVSAPEGISLRVQVKSPGILQDPQNIMSTAVMDLNYNTQFPNTRIPDAYETLLLDVLEGNHSNFVRKDELEFAWKIFTPLLHLTDQNSLQILPYERGSSGPVPKKKELSENDL